LGRAVAEELAAEGTSLILCARDEARLQETREFIQRQNDVPILAVKADVADAADAERVVREGLARFGCIDILITNVGGPPAGTFETLNRDAWEQATRSILMSVYELVRWILPGMKERRWGRILNITSIAAKAPIPNLLLSNSLRPAVTGLARTLADEVATFGVTVNTILPGYTRTERVETLARTVAERDGIPIAELEARWEASIPMKRMGQPREFAALAAFLVSERASYITGGAFAVDGGWMRSLF